MVSDTADGKSGYFFRESDYQTRIPFRAARLVRRHGCANNLILGRSQDCTASVPKAAAKCAKPGCSDQSELAVDMVDRAEATPGLSGALLAAPWRAW
jgi:hypothetical protein